MKLYKFSFPLLAVLVLLAAGCKKVELSTPADGAHFVTTDNSGVLQVLDAQSEFVIPVGTTNVAAQDRTVEVEITSKSGAVLGTHYTVSGASGKAVTIAGGTARTNLVVKGVVNQYAAGRKDTLLFRVTDNGGIKSTSFDSVFTLVLRGPCFEGEVNLDLFKGSYTKTTETYGSGSPYGPYTTTISSVTTTSLTTGTIVVTNLWDAGWEALTFNLDWTDPANRTAVLVAKPSIAGSNSGDLSPTYAGTPMQARPFAGQTGTFSACNSTLTLRMQLGVAGVGFFSSLYTVNMAR